MITGRLSLTTPEGVRLLLTPAGPVPRAWAWALDLLVWLGFIGVCAMTLGWSKAGKGIYLVLLFVSYWGYPIVCEVYFGGSTLGKRAAGIMVVRVDGLPVGWRESCLRNLMLVADFLPFLYTTGLLCMLSDVQFRRLGDIVAGTQVVYRDVLTVKPLLNVDAIDDEFGRIESQPLPYPLSPVQQRSLIDLVERESSLPPERVLELATIAQPLTGQTGEKSLRRVRAYVAGLIQ